ncbi:MAG: SDR family NAD(P)-dependent oxidoreductase, partial [Pseudomonadota bacterium]
MRAVPEGTFALFFPADAPVAVSRDALARQLAVAAEVFPLGRGDRVLLSDVLQSDALTLELLWPLCAGATVVAGPPAVDTAARLAAMDAAAITAAHVRPSSAIALAHRAPIRGPRRLLVSGEPLSPVIANALTEAGIAMTSALCLPQFAGPVLANTAPGGEGEFLPLGLPVGVAAQIVDRHGVAVPVGVPGRLTVDGTPTMLTVRRKRDGSIALVSVGRDESGGEAVEHGPCGPDRRLDGLVDGRFVDLAAVAEAACAVTGVHQAFATARREPEGHNLLVLYAVPAGAALPQDLQSNLAERLPVWSRPDAIVAVSALPLDAHGAVDMAALGAIPVLDGVDAHWERALASAGDVLASAGDVAVLRVPATQSLGTVTLPALRVRSAAPTAAVRDEAAGAPLGQDRPAYANGGPLSLAADAPRTLTEALRRTAAQAPDKGLVFAAATGPDTSLSYADLLAEAQRVAGGLLERGLRPADPVIIQIAEHRRYFPAFWGAVLAGLTPVTIAVSPDYSAPSGTVLKLLNAWELLGYPPIVSAGAVVDDLAALASHREGAAPVVLALETLAQSEPAEPFEPEPQDVLFLQLSSGSTGVPKVIQVTHRGVVAHIHGDILACGDHGGDIAVNWLPLDHVVPLLTCHLKDIYLGATQVQLPTNDVIADPLVWLRAMERFGATRSWAPNFGFKLVARALQATPGAQFDLSTLRHLMNCAEQVTQPVVEEFLAEVAPFGIGPDVMQAAFGMAETCTCMTYENGYAGEASLLRADKSSLGSVLRAPAPGQPAATFMRLGPPVPGIEIRVADAAGNTLPEGVIGRLQIRGPVVTPGYVSNASANEDAFVGDGWFNSGDLAVIVDGNLALTGREKETIIVNGANFYCYEIEDVVNAVEGVEPTFAAATATPSEETGTEGLAVFFVPHEGGDANAISRAVRRSVVARLGIDPSHVIAIPKAEFPKTTSGKIQRTALKARLAEDAGSDGHTVPAWFYREVWRPAKAPRTRAAAPLVLVEPAGETLRAVAARWRETGGDVRSEPIAEIGNSHSHPSETAVLDLSETTAGDQPSLGGIVDPLVRLAALAQRLEGAGEGLRGRLVVLTRGASAVGEGSVSPAAAAVRAAVRTLAQETPALTIQLIDLPAAPTPADTDAVLAELRRAPADPQIALRAGARLVPRLEAVDPTDTPAATLLRGGRYLVTGGFGQLGQALCTWLVANCDARLVVFGRSSPADVGPVRGGFGETLVYSQTDIADLNALRAALRDIECDGTIDGVFHLAGAAEGRAISQETRATLHATLAAKVGGALNLASVFADRPEVPLINFGSVNGVFGGAGAGAYAAANAALDAIAHQRSMAGGAARTIGWSQWSASDLADRFGLAQFATKRGFMPIKTEDGLAAIPAAMAGEDPALLVGLDGTNPHIRPLVSAPPQGLEEYCAYVAGGSPSSASKVYDRFGTPVPCAIMAVDAIPRSADGAVDREALLCAAGRAVGSGATRAPRSDTERRLAAIWCDLLGRDTIGCEEDFFAVGGHSLIAARLMLAIRQEFARDLPLRALFGASTIAGIAAAIDGTEQGGPVLPDCLVPLQPDGDGAPIFCVHPAGGSPLCYLLLADALGRQQPFLGFQAVGLVDGRPPLPTVEAIAAHYVEAIVPLTAGAPVRLAAWSSGGPVAFEMARQIEAAGGSVDLLALFDCGVMESDNPVRGSAPVRAAKGLWMIARYMRQIRWPRSWGELRALA